MTERSDEELMAAHARGQPRAFDELFRRHSPRLRAVLSKGLRKKEDAKDLLQQVFLQLHRHRADYQPERPFKPWLYTIALNVKRQHLRYVGRRPETEFDEVVARTRADGKLDHHRYEMRQQLDRTLAELSEAARDVVLLHWFGDLSMAEIATVIGTSEAAVKVRAHRAYQAMRTAIENESAVTPADTQTEEAV